MRWVGSDCLLVLCTSIGLFVGQKSVRHGANFSAQCGGYVWLFSLGKLDNRDVSAALLGTFGLCWWRMEEVWARLGYNFSSLLIIFVETISIINYRPYLSEFSFVQQAATIFGGQILEAAETYPTVGMSSISPILSTPSSNTTATQLSKPSLFNLVTRPFNDCKAYVYVIRLGTFCAV